MPAQGYRYLDVALEEGFDAPGDWRTYEGDGLFLGIRDSAFVIDIRGRQYVWTQLDAQRVDLVMEGEFTQTSSAGHDAFGLACRLDPANSGRGYFFLISGDGHASIRWSNGRSLEAIVPAQPSAHINRGGEANLLRAVCIGDYLALWVNDRFVMDARDRRGLKGSLGLAGVMNRAGQRLTVSIDNLKVWRAAPDAREP